jgi:formylglycine-generating enzyme required for sulfatase activity
MKTNIITAALLAALAVPASAIVNIDWVTVGNAGNTAESWTGYGAVNYTYNIGKHEVTIGQYAEFLNAAAQSDPYGLWHSFMETRLTTAGISRSGNSGSYSYSVIGSASRPIAYVSWFDAARFSNWLHNGQGSGSTEAGVYNLGGATAGVFTAQPGATFRLPTVDEWYKAAYYDPTLNGGIGGYWEYPTQSNDYNGIGNAVGSLSNQANLMVWNGSEYVFSTTQSSIYDISQNYLTEVGAFTESGSYYGTFDQGGNLRELNDTVYGVNRGYAGGGWQSTQDVMSIYSNTGANISPTGQGGELGFRLAYAVPEPTTGLLAALGLFPLLSRRRKA